MRLKIYRAASVSEAMARVRLEMGPDALILATRRAAGGVEVTAALEPQEAPAPPRADPADPARLASLAWHSVPAALAGRLATGDLGAALAATLSFGALPLAQGERPLMLVGPPGAGKTLAVARLATRMVLAGVSPLVINADGQRAGATEQLAAFTRLLGLTLIVASHPVTLSRALARRERGAPVLIDMPGSDPLAAAAATEITACAATADAALALVLPAGLDPSEAADLAAGYAELGATLMVATRLDCARRLGGVIAAAQAGRLALAEAGVSGSVADGLVPLTPSFLAERLTRAVPNGSRS